MWAATERWSRLEEMYGDLRRWGGGRKKEEERRKEKKKNKNKGKGKEKKSTGVISVLLENLIWAG